MPGSCSVSGAVGESDTHMRLRSLCSGKQCFGTRDRASAGVGVYTNATTVSANNQQNLLAIATSTVQAPTLIAAANASANFSASSQNVTLTATVTSSAGPVNGGSVTFTLSQGGATMGTAVTSGAVTSGAAIATYVLPAGTPAGNYTITAVYNERNGI